MTDPVPSKEPSLQELMQWLRHRHVVLVEQGAADTYEGFIQAHIERLQGMVDSRDRRIKVLLRLAPEPEAYYAALNRLTVAMGNPALQWNDGETIESALIDEAARRLSSAPEPAREYPDPVTAFEKLAEALPDGFQFPTMEPNNEPLTHMEILSAVHHHASEIVRLTATVPVECSPQPPRDGQ